MKNFIITMVLAVLFAAVANAKEVYFAKYRFIRTEFGEMLPKTMREAYCPTRIEIDFDDKTITVKTKTHGTAVHKFDTYNIDDNSAQFYNENMNLVCGLLFEDSNFQTLRLLLVQKADGTQIMYSNISD